MNLIKRGLELRFITRKNKSERKYDKRKIGFGKIFIKINNYIGQYIKIAIKRNQN